MNTNNTLEKTSLQLITSSHERGALYSKFKSKIIHNPCLDRTLVSFQANKETQFSWFKYREGFSEKLVKYLIETLKPKPGALLDPFSGVGTSLFTASDLNWQTTGIELLPVGVFAIEVKINARTVDAEALSLIINQIITVNFSDYYDPQYVFNHLAITKGAFPESQEIELVGYISYCNNHIQNISIRNILLFAAFCSSSPFQIMVAS